MQREGDDNDDNSDPTAAADAAGAQDANRQMDNGTGYEIPDPQEAEEARLRAKKPSEYVKIQSPDNLEDLYSLPMKKKK